TESKSFRTLKATPPDQAASPKISHSSWSDHLRFGSIRSGRECLGFRKRRRHVGSALVQFKQAPCWMKPKVQSVSAVRSDP
ncbi:hypothetical protein, partial [Bradyrhizobium diazoefficiens]|uniref:hypothetical protein n=1 Tax=Bradyrhizobium diazoefficiens TaxID=1355477 RepID=UPI001B8B1915